MDSFSNTKSKVENLVYKMASSTIEVSNTTSFEVVTPLYSIQLYSNNNSSEQENNDIKNNLTSLNISSCQDKITKKYNLSYLLIAKVGYSETLNNASTLLVPNNTNIISAGSSVNFRLFNPNTKEEYNISEECNSVPSFIKISLPSVNKINAVISRRLQKDGVNILNQSDSFYVNRCHIYTNDSNSNIQLTIRERKNTYFKNQTISCSEGCIFNGFDINNYMICQCVNTKDISANVVRSAAIVFGSLNYDIALCYYTLEPVNNIYKC